MVTINPHTTRATGTVLTAAIYNADHQNHVTNATSINATAAYTNVANTFTLQQTMLYAILSSTSGLRRDVSNSLMQLFGGTGAGAKIQLYGQSHATNANQALIDSDTLLIRDEAGGSTASVTVQGDLTVTGTLTGAAAAFPSGTVMLFQQTAAPTGWTKLTVHNNKALRLTTGTVTTGGSVAFTTAFASQAVTGTNANTTATGTNSGTTSTGTVGGTALTEANLPVHSHPAGTLAFSGSTNTTGDHSHIAPTDSAATTHDVLSASVVSNSGAINTGANTSTAGNHSHTVSGSVTGSTGNTGSGTTHTHSLTMNSHTHTFTGSAHTHTFTGNSINLAVQFVDVIMASKD